MMKRQFSVIAVAVSACARAQEPFPPSIDKADTVWVLVASVLVLFMTPALSLFYGGLVRHKNVLSTMMHSIVLMGLGTVIWFLLAFTLAFGKSNGWIGGFDWLWGQGVSRSAPYPTQTIPLAVFMLFQMKFAIITPALISGAVAERMKFSGYVLFTALWSILIYAPIACWVWNPDGWLAKQGVLDFAGGSVVHLASGVAALAACVALGPRKRSTTEPHNVPFVLLGAGLLWVGWIGFNAGSALSVGPVAVGAFVATQLAGAAGLIGWCALENRSSREAFGGRRGLGSRRGACNGHTDRGIRRSRARDPDWIGGERRMLSCDLAENQIPLRRRPRRRRGPWRGRFSRHAPDRTVRDRRR